jgi:hypothetical protein
VKVVPPAQRGVRCDIAAALRVQEPRMAGHLPTLSIRSSGEPAAWQVAATVALMA